VNPFPMGTGVKVWLSRGYTDMRCSFPSLALRVQCCRKESGADHLCFLPCACADAVGIMEVRNAFCVFFLSKESRGDHVANSDWSCTCGRGANRANVEKFKLNRPDARQYLLSINEASQSSLSAIVSCATSFECFLCLVMCRNVSGLVVYFCVPSRFGWPGVVFIPS
jgi:hypothetical protein